jgi:hypothetical protein
MNRFVPPARPRRAGALTVVSAAVLLLLLALLAAAAGDVLRASDDEQLEALRRSVARAAVHCYAVEGAYPQSLAELEARYGLVYDKQKYLVDYRAFASNLMPDITVMPR